MIFDSRGLLLHLPSPLSSGGSFFTWTTSTWGCLLSLRGQQGLLSREDLRKWRHCGRREDLPLLQVLDVMVPQMVDAFCRR